MDRNACLVTLFDNSPEQIIIARICDSLETGQARRNPALIQHQPREGFDIYDYGVDIGVAALSDSLGDAFATRKLPEVRLGIEPDYTALQVFLPAYCI
jgi:hypothetical protein